MTHDITHCTGHGCPRRHSCLRAAAHDELRLLDLEGYYSYLKPESCINNDYYHFLNSQL